MSPEDTVAAYKILIEGTFDLILNMNDTFHYASADCESMPADDVETLLGVLSEYKHEALTAYAAVKRGYDPTIARLCTPKFYAAKEAILALKRALVLDGDTFAAEHQNDYHRMLPAVKALVGDLTAKGEEPTHFSSWFTLLEVLQASNRKEIDLG